MSTQIFIRHNFMKSQRGALLIVGLVMVLLLSVIALAAIRGSGLQEIMAGNMQERNLAFQAAESALRDCEEVDLGGNAQLSGDCINGKGVCGDLDATPQNSVVNNDNYWRTKARPITAAAFLPGVAKQPTCLVEVLPITDPIATAAPLGLSIGTGANRNNSLLPMPYRVTAQGVGATESAPVVTQSTFNRPL